MKKHQAEGNESIALDKAFAIISSVQPYPGMQTFYSQNGCFVFQSTTAGANEVHRFCLKWLQVVCPCYEVVDARS